LSYHLGNREIQHFIDRRYTPSITRQTFAKRFSLNNLPIARVADGGDADVDAAFTAARFALHGEYCAHRVAANVDVGITWVNSWFLRDLRTPFGGARQSGIGREGGVHSLEFHTELRNVHQALRA
jgi:acyl-CoA reductase-like NAD-dependent aldehyde dehydrogenase